MVYHKFSDSLHWKIDSEKSVTFEKTDFRVSAFVNTNDMFMFDHFFAQERSMYI